MNTIQKAIKMKVIIEHRITGYDFRKTYWKSALKTLDDIISGISVNKEEMLLINYKLKECGLHKRRVIDYKIPLLMETIDGNSDNWKRENIRLLCYNHFFLMVRSLLAREHSELI